MRKFRILVDGSQYEVEVEEIGGSSAVEAPVAAPVVAAPVAEKAAPAPAPVKKAAPAVKVSGGIEVKAPMPGNILKFSVQNGASVVKGQAIAVLEAMKMENDIAAPADGVVSFAINAGTMVETGTLLAVIQ